MLFEDRQLEDISLQVRLRLRAHYNTLKTAEKKAADFIILEPEFVVNSTIGECSDKAGCSEPTFIRLARKLGYGGFADLKENLLEQEDIVKQSNRIYEDITDEDSSQELVNKVFGLAKQAIDDTLRIFDFNEFAKASEAIKNAKNLAFFGTGDASAVARSAYIKFTRIGFNCHYAADSDLMLMLAANLKKGDVTVLISHSGRTKSIINVAKLLSENGVTVLSITNFPATPLVRNSDICIQTSAFTEHLKGEVMANRVVGLCIIESLYIETIRSDANYRENMKRSLKSVAVNKE